MKKKVKSQYDNPKSWEKKIPISGDAGVAKVQPQKTPVKKEKMKEEKVPLSVALIFSLMLPGLGHLLLGLIMPGLLWAFVVGSCYLSYLNLGIAIHILCLFELFFSQRGEQDFKKEKLPYLFFLIALFLALSFYIAYRNNVF